MNRRSFVGTLLGAIGAFTLDPAELLWKPEEKKIFIPKATYMEQGAVRVEEGSFDGIHHKNCKQYLTWKHIAASRQRQLLSFGGVRYATPQEVDAVTEGLMPECYASHMKYRDMV